MMSTAGSDCARFSRDRPGDDERVAFQGFRPETMLQSPNVGVPWASRGSRCDGPQLGTDPGFLAPRRSAGAVATASISMRKSGCISDSTPTQVDAAARRRARRLDALDHGDTSEAIPDTRSTQPVVAAIRSLAISVYSREYPHRSKALRSGNSSRMTFW